MPLDAITINALGNELKPAVAGARIDKVQQPGRDTVILSLRGPAGNCKLLIAAGTGAARVHLSTESYENPQQPPMFCMLLRKHLVGAKVTNITQENMERMLAFELDAFDEMGVRPHVRYIAREDRTILSMVSNGLGISLLPELMVRHSPYPLVVCQPPKAFYRRIAIGVKDEKALSNSTQRFVDHVRAWVQVNGFK